jgi:hypothetical protein
MPQKMIDVRPEMFLQGVGQYSYDDMMVGLSLGSLGATESDILMGLRGVGRLAQTPAGQPKSVMDAIINNAAEMNRKVEIISKARQQAASTSPTLAVALAKKEAQTSMPGANEAKAVREALNAAAQKAMAAKRAEQAARMLLNQSDKRGAAAKAVNAMTLAREAAIMANKAEKTRVTRSLDILANTLKAQADYLDGIINLQVKRSGDNARTMALAATAQSLREQVKRIQAISGTVAAQPNVPPNAPTQQRIADLANKFNIRTAAEQKFMLSRAVVSVLSDLSENPMAQVKDYAGAVTFYGADDAGRLMADMEFGNSGRAMAGLRGMVHGVGYFDTTAILAQGDATISAAHSVANETYNNVILPAAGLGGLGRMNGLGDMESDHGWCNRNNSNAKQGGFPAAELDKCKRCPNPVSPPGSKKNEWGYYEWFGKYECLSPSPESPVGRQGRGMTVDWGAVVGGWVGQKPPTPPTPTQPPPQVTIGTGGSAIVGTGSGSGSAAMTAKKDNTMLYVGLGLAGAVVVGGGVYFAFFRK